MATNVPSLKGAKPAGSRPAGKGWLQQQGQYTTVHGTGGHPQIQDGRLAKQTIGGKSTVNSTPA